MAGEQGVGPGDPGEPRDAGGKGDGDGGVEHCDQCGVPLPVPRREYCALGAGCCAGCMARCERAGRCGKLRDEAAWREIDRLRAVAREWKPW